MFEISPVVVNPGETFDACCYSSSYYRNVGFFDTEPNVRGIRFASYPPTGGQITTTRYSIDILYEQPDWPSDWDYLSGY